MIKTIEVKELYGEFNHTINIKEGNITLVLGENGMGKTIILKMIKYLFDNNLYEFGKYEFLSFNITFDDKSHLEIIKEIKKSKLKFRYEDYILNIFFKKENSKQQKFSIKSDDIIESYRHERKGVGLRRGNYSRMNHLIRTYVPMPIDHIGPERWLDITSGTVYNSLELIERYASFFPKELIDELKNTSVPEWFISITKSIKVKLVETQRLLTKINSEEKEYKDSVLQYSNELKEIIKNKAIEATNLSTKLDRTYTNRLIEKITSRKASRNFIDTSLRDLESKRLFLIRVGLLEYEEEAILPINLNEEYLENETLIDVLDIYIEDSNEKLSVYTDLSLKLNTLIEIINKRFNYKSFYVNKNEGFVFRSIRTEKKIPLTNLSSGEQHELVLFYDLLFNTIEGSLILIDEPEISLHINWQNEFINDLQDVSRLISINSIIATHSPDIINNNWDLTTQL